MSEQSLAVLALPAGAHSQHRKLTLILAVALGLASVLLLLGFATVVVPTEAAQLPANSQQPLSAVPQLRQVRGAGRLDRVSTPSSELLTPNVPQADPPLLQVSYPISRGLTPRLGSLPSSGNHPADPGKHPPEEHRPAPAPFGKHPEAAPAAGPDQPGRPNGAMPGLIADFEGIGAIDGVYPPDNNGDIGYDPATGRKYYFQWINLHYAVWDVTTPTTPTLVISPTAGNILWATALPGSQCGTFNDGDPIVLFDEQAHRWLISQFAFESEFHQCVAVSQSADPTGAWNVYDYQYADGATFFNDYAKFGVWPDPVYNAYFMTVNQFNAAGTVSLGAGIAAFDRAAMLAGDAAPAMLLFNLNAISNHFDNLLPADLDGAPPPAGTPGIVVAVDDNTYKPQLGADALRIWEYRPNWVNPLSSTFGINGTPNYTLPVTPFTLLPCVTSFSQSCIPQAGTAQRLDSLGDRLMYRAAFRTISGTQSLVLNHTVLADGADRAGNRWYELNRNAGSGKWTVHQQQTYAPSDGMYRWIGSMATDRQGDMALGFSIASSNDFASIRYAGRLASDPLSSLPQREMTVTNGGGAQLAGGARWGDYTMMGVDPQNGCTFWYTNEYLPVTSEANWHTRIGAFAFPQCAPAPVGSISGIVTRASNSTPISGSLVVATDASGLGTYSSLSNAIGQYQLVGIPTGAYTLTASAYAFKTAIRNNVSVNAGVTTTRNLPLTALPQSDLAVTIGDNPNPVFAGSALTYTLNTSNLGPDAASTTVRLTDTLPPGVALDDAAGTGWTCGPAGNAVVCTRPGMALGVAAPVVIRVTAPITPGSLPDHARISADGSYDLGPLNDDVSISTTVQGQADLSISMDGPTHVPPGGVLVYTLTVANAGPSLMGLTTLTVSNPTNIVINDDARATPYPSTLTVTGLTPLLGTAAGVYNFQHSYPEDVDVLLVAPGGQQTILMSDPAGADDAFGVNLRFDDTSPDTLPCVNAVLDSGAYRPTDCAGTFGDDLFPAPAPAGPYTATMSVFNGADPNGTWRLYVRDDAPGDTGFIGGGWSLSLTSDRGNMVVTDTLPLGAVFLGASGAGWNCTPIGAEVRCVAPSFAFGTAPNLVLQATTPVTPGLLINRAVLGSGIFDPAPLNNQAVVTNTLFGMYIPLYMK